MVSRFTARVIALCLGILFGCNAKDDGLADIELRSGVAVLYDGGSTSRYSQLDVTDVEVIGDRIVVLVTVEEVVTADIFGMTVGGWPMYFVSEDRGQTWRQHDVKNIDKHAQYPHLRWPNGLIVHKGQVYELVPDTVERALGNFPVMRLYRLDFEVDRRHFLGVIEGLPRYDGTHLITHLGDKWWAWDPATCTVAETGPIPAQEGPGPTCSPQIWWDHGTFVGTSRELSGTCQIKSPKTQEVNWCEVSMTPPYSFQMTFRCASGDELPVEDPKLVMEHFTPHGLIVRERAKDESFFTSLAAFDATGVRLVPIGPGELHSGSRKDFTQWGPERDRFDGFIGIVQALDKDNYVTTLYSRAGANRFEPSTIPTRPCPTGRPCGYRPFSPVGAHRDSVLQWVQRLGKKTLVLYLVDVGRPSSGMSRNMIYFSLQDHVVDEGEVFHSPLADQCARASACFPPRTLSMYNCLYHWRRAEQTDEQLDTFLAATDCTAIQAQFPSYTHPPSCSTESHVCSGEVAINCDGTSLYEINCADKGMVCELSDEGWARCAPTGGPCESSNMSCDANGNVNMCGQILDCSATGRVCYVNKEGQADCGFAEPACVGPGPICKGTHVFMCTEPGYGRPNNSCARTPGLQCVSGACEAIDSACSTSDTCAGSKLLFCFEQVKIEVDCKALGLDCVVDNDDSNGGTACR